MKQANCTEYPPRVLPVLRPLLLATTCAWLLTTGLPAPAQDQTTPAAAGTQPQAQKAETEAEPWSIALEQRNMKLLAATQAPATVVWQEAMELQFLSLYEQDFTGNPVGAILILNAEGQHSNWPETSRRIRLSLPEFGWNTLSTQLPPPRPEPVPPGEAEAAAQIDVEALSLARLHRSIEYLHERGQFNIILIGNGVGAARAACYISELPASSQPSQSRLIRAMVFVNARNRIPGSDKQLQDCLPDPAVPVLDIYTGGQQRDHLEAEQRLKSSRRRGFAIYQQLHFPDPGQTTSQGENLLSRRIRGFLDRHAKGVKVDKAIINR